MTDTCSRCARLAELLAEYLTPESPKPPTLTHVQVVHAHLDERTVQDPQSRVPFKTLYEDYRQWCPTVGHRPLAFNKYASVLNYLNYPKVRGTGGRVYREGLRILP
jgi:hypothetical protein